MPLPPFHLPHSVQCSGPARFRRLVGQPQARETRKVRRLEVQLPQRRHVEGQIRLRPAPDSSCATESAAAYRSPKSAPECCPSTYSTNECTVDCGCTVTRTAEGGMSNSRQASMISRPLLSMVAESIVIRRPMTQVGCFSACSDRDHVRNRSAAVCRKGPPEAVSQMRRTSCCVPRTHALVNGVVLGVDGQQRHVLRAAAAGQDLSRSHHASLFARPTGFPASTAAYVASRPATPTIAETTKSDFG